MQRAALALVLRLLPGAGKKAQALADASISTALRSEVQLWLLFNRGEAMYRRGGCGPAAVRMNPRRSSRGVGFGNANRAARKSVGGGRSRGRPSLP